MTRSLGYLERLMTGRALSDTYTNFLVGATYNEPLSLNTIIPALRKTLLENPFLLAKVYHELSTVSVVQEDLLVEDLIFDENSVDALDDVFLAKLDKIAYDPQTDKLHFKIILFNGFKGLVFLADHVLFDGCSGSRFHEVFFSNLTAVEPIPESNVILTAAELSRDFVFPRPMEQLLEVDFESQGVPARESKYITPSTSTKWPSFENANRDYKPLHFKLNVPKEDLKVILKRVKSLGVSLTSYIGLSFLVAVVQPVLSELTQDDHYIENKIAINLRRKVQEGCKDNLDFGGILYPGDGIRYPLSLLEKLEPKSEEFWKILTHGHSLLLDEIESLTIQHQYNSLKYSNIEDGIAFYANKLGKPRPDGFKLSNLGLIRFPENKLKVVDLVFNQTPGLVAGDFMLSCISTEEGGLNMCLSAHEGLCEISRLKILLNKFKQDLLGNVL